MPTFDPSYMLDHLPKIFSTKGKFRDAFYAKLLEQSPELAVHFERYPIAKTDMLEKFMFDLIRSSAGGKPISDLAQAFAASHAKFNLKERHYVACHEALIFAFQDVAQGKTNLPSDAELNFHMFLEIVFHELRKAGRPS